MAASMNDNPLTGVDPLLPKGGNTINSCDNAMVRREAQPEPIEQVLGGKTYRIDTSRLMLKMAQKNPLWKKALKTSAVIVASPFIIPTVMFHTLSMYIGPVWWRNKVTAALVSVAMKEVGALFEDDRKELLQRNIGPNDLVLDLGAGAGYYLNYLSQAAHLVAIEPVANFHDNYRQRAVQAGMQPSQVELHACDIEAYSQANPDKRASFDCIVLGNVLCEVDDQGSTLHCVHQLLKPGGHVYFSEHVGRPKGTWARCYQDFVNPWWRTAGAGCNCNRDSLVNIRNMKYRQGWQVISWSYLGFKVVQGPFVLGLAMKNPAS